ncbi:helix-turn-helix transcriptional regulator [Corticibacterium sp. UT-5YL-CI-8]|nr:helix-turn-helix transcriptional regulator [Tianweitania sp. UT-5YL-CI-8]
MTFHSRSIVELGDLLSGLTKSIEMCAPLETSLDIVRHHFGAQVAVLAMDNRARQGDPTLFFSPVDLSGSQHPSFSQLKETHYVLANEPEKEDAGTYTLWLFRERLSGKFDAEESAMCAIIASQFVRTLRMVKRMDSSEVERILYSDVLDKLNVGVIIVDCAGKITKTSTVAQRFVSTRDGLQVQSGKLRAMSAVEDRELQAAIKAALGETGLSRGLSLTKRSGTRNLGIMIRPVMSGGDSVAIYIRDCDLAPEVEGEFVRQIFDLTPAEAAVTRRLTAGLSLEDAATSLDISRNTARAHLRSIFSKSGITRQTELVRLVLNSAVILGGRGPQAV